jgi:hypothetical protein
MNVILTAGLATRMGDRAPGGCKALAMVDGRPAIEHQLELLGNATIVCRTPHARRLEQYGRVVIHDWLGGPALALRAALAVLQGHATVTVLYADTLLKDLPEGRSWCATAWTDETREWDLVVGDSVVRRRGPGEACVGAYRFDDPWLVASLIDVVGAGQLGPVVNLMQPRFVQVEGWRDIG